MCMALIFFREWWQDFKNSLCWGLILRGPAHPWFLLACKRCAAWGFAHPSDEAFKTRDVSAWVSVLCNPSLHSSKPLLSSESSNSQSQILLPRSWQHHSLIGGTRGFSNPSQGFLELWHNSSKCWGPGSLPGARLGKNLGWRRELLVDCPNGKMITFLYSKQKWPFPGF